MMLMALLESDWLIRREQTQEVLYDRIELIQPNRRAELLADLKERTGLDIIRIEIGHIDLLKDAARIIIFHY